MIEIFFQGIGLGFIISLAAGPVFINLVNTSIHKGFVSGVFMAVGISVSDIIYIMLAFVGLSQFTQNEDEYTVFLGYAGGVIMITFGAFYFLRKPAVIKSNINIRSGRSLFRQFLKGVVINGVNPFVLIFWFGLMTFAAIENNYSQRELLFFFSGVVTTIFSTDLIKAYLADKVRKFMTYRVTNILYKAMGLILFGFGIRMIHYAVTVS